MTRRTALLTLLSCAAAACSHVPPQTASVMQQGAPAKAAMFRDPGSGINAAALRRDLYAFADDSFHGRETGTADARRAAAFLARRVQQLGLEPAGDSLYMQRVPMVRSTFARGTQLTVTWAGGQSQNLRLGADLTPVISVGSDAPAPSRSAEGDLLFVGNGPSDDKEAVGLIQMSPQNRILVTVVTTPPDRRLSAQANAENDKAMVMRMARLVALRPAAVIVLMGGGMEEEYRQHLRGLLEDVSLDGPEIADSARKIPMLLFGPARRGSPLLPARWPNDGGAQLLDHGLSLHVELDRKPFTAYNVVAVARGHDPRMNKSYLAYGAHYDHLGILPPETHKGRRASADSIANGADDDGTGSVALLAIAQQMMIYRPRRSVLFVWHVGEEQGMLGSAYFTSHPTVPIDSVVAQFNADMIGRNDSDMVALVGPRAAPNYLSWRLGIIVDSVNRASPIPLRIERKWDDPDDPERLYERSDHYSYAKKNIPIIFFTSGTHEDYHRVTDEAAKIDYDKLARVSQLMLEAGLAIANRSTRPTSEAVRESISSRQP
jgi:peptidase M28-like protein